MALLSEDPLHDLLSKVFVLSLVLYYVFTFPRWRHLLTFLRARFGANTPLEVQGVPSPGLMLEEPHVTIAICAYNEGAVVPRTIDSACSVDWPKDKLTVHVCDDSTDPSSIKFIESAVARWRKRGFDVERLTRPDRVGYKAGNLRYNFTRIKRSTSTNPVVRRVTLATMGRVPIGVDGCSLEQFHLLITDANGSCL